MWRQLLKVIFPSPERLQQLKILRYFGHAATVPALWKINRRSFSRAILIGTFWGLMPIPFHTWIIIVFALYFRANIPLAAALAWLVNPISIIPILYSGFWIGSQIYHVKMINGAMMKGVLHQIEYWVSHFGHGHIDFHLAKILLTGLWIQAFIAAISAFIIVRILWRIKVIRKWRQRYKE